MSSTGMFSKTAGRFSGLLEEIVEAMYIHFTLVMSGACEFIYKSVLFSIIYIFTVIDQSACKI